MKKENTSYHLIKERFPTKECFKDIPLMLGSALTSSHPRVENGFVNANTHSLLARCLPTIQWKLNCSYCSAGCGVYQGLLDHKCVCLGCVFLLLAS